MNLMLYGNRLSVYCRFGNIVVYKNGNETVEGSGKTLRAAVENLRIENPGSIPAEDPDEFATVGPDLPFGEFFDLHSERCRK